MYGAHFREFIEDNEEEEEEEVFKLFQILVERKKIIRLTFFQMQLETVLNLTMFERRRSLSALEQIF